MPVQGTRQLGILSQQLRSIIHGISSLQLPLLGLTHRAYSMFSLVRRFFSSASLSVCWKLLAFIGVRAELLSMCCGAHVAAASAIGGCEGQPRAWWLCTQSLCVADSFVLHRMSAFGNKVY